ncbi:cuticle protein AMP1A-like isoform X2 [Panulirus ornatus]|uniref:cuticle protein AMP1A-like isoform X2 n=1 Tax=Panulirus ornatus TaxID=150431 RepID=UPI003A89E506
MLQVILAVLAAVAVAEYASHESDEVPILRDDRVHDEAGTYTYSVETGDGIYLSQSGSEGPEGTIVKAGEYSYTAPDGTPVHVKFVANENGYQPESDLLPVAPEFPHPIPQFVLDQIAFAAEQRARGDLSEESDEAPSQFYSNP